MTCPSPLRLTIRSSKNNPNHHLWFNNGTWWCHFTLKSTVGTSARKRISLKTKDLENAKTRRDKILQAIQTAAGGIVD
jgi:hypothetical protein